MGDKSQISKADHARPDHARADHARPAAAAATHKFGVGAHVSLLGKSEETLFKITRLLPDGGSGLQYRIKNEQEGYERVAVERLLTAVRR